MSAKDFPVTFPWGATSPPYGTPAMPRHRGNDRATPTGTPVVINGTQIGLTGATGLVTGPHLHIQEWVGEYKNDRNPQNEFKSGTVTQTGFLSQFGNYVTVQQPDGSNDTYCHLSRIDVKVGDKVGDMPNEGDVHNAYLQANGRKATPEEVKIYTSKPWSAPDGLYYGKTLVDLKEAKIQGFKKLDQEVYVKG
jgi:hypothetical protein